MQQHSLYSLLENLSPDRSLMVINDRQVREKIYSDAVPRLKKIKSLINSYNDFFQTDKLQFENWHNLTFSSEKQDIERIEQLHKKLLELQIHICYIAKFSKVSVIEAFNLLQDEERQYRDGDPEWQFIIEKLRGHRLDFARQQIQNKKNHPSTLFDFATEETPTAQNQLIEKKPDLTKLNRKDRSIYYYFKEQSDLSLKKSFSETKDGQVLFKQLFQISMETGDWHLLARIWKATNESYRNKIIRKIPAHLVSFLNQLISNSYKDQLNTEDLEYQEASLKSAFRYLARTFHPDTQVAFNDDCSSTFSDKMLQDARSAYLEKNLGRLQRLVLIAAIHIGDLNSLTIDELKQSSIELEDELKNLKKSFKTYEKHPAWKFSSKRSYKPLELKIRQDLAKQRAPLVTELQQLEVWFSQCGLLGEELKGY